MTPTTPTSTPISAPIFEPSPELANQVVDYLCSPNYSLRDIADLSETTLEALCLWLETDATQSRIASLHAAMLMWTRLVCASTLPVVVNNLKVIMRESNVMLDRMPLDGQDHKNLSLRTRIHETSIRAASHFMRLSTINRPLSSKPRPSKSAPSPSSSPDSASPSASSSAPAPSPASSPASASPSASSLSSAPSAFSSASPSVSSSSSPSPSASASSGPGDKGDTGTQEVCTENTGPNNTSLNNTGTDAIGVPPVSCDSSHVSRAAASPRSG